MGRRRVRLKDIAERADVAISTVSSVLNDKSGNGAVRISNLTAIKVRRIAAEMGYLSRGMIGLIVPFLDGFLAPMIDGVSRALRKEKFSLAMGVATGMDLELEIDEIRGMEEKGFDCVIMMPSYSFLDGIDSGSNAFRNSRQVVMMNRGPLEAYPYITVDHEQCGYLATKHLLELGHRRIAFGDFSARTVSLVPSGPYNMREARLRGYARALQEYDGEQLVFERKEELLDHPEVTGIYCANTRGACELLGYCYDRGVKVPDHLSIVGQDDDWHKSMVRPSITAIDVRAEEVGSRGGRMALDFVEGSEPESAVLQPKLIERDSTRST